MNENAVPAGADQERSRAEALAEALRDSDPFARADSLGRVGPDASLLEPIAAALEDEYPLVRREAVRALMRIGGAPAARVLVGVAAHDLSAEVREEAVAALAAILREGVETGTE
jgi:HEAT repeat protein